MDNHAHSPAPHPHQKRRSMVKQCEELITGQISRIGHSRHRDKIIARNSEQYVALSRDRCGSYAIGQQTGIYSGGTTTTYLRAWCQFAKYCKENFGLKDIKDIQSDHVTAFLSSKIDKELQYSSVDNLCSALEKMGVALRLEYGDNLAKEWSDTISEQRLNAAVILDPQEHINRAYKNPEAVIENMTKKEHRLAAALQLEGGARVKEISLLGAKNIESLGRIHLYNCKGSENRYIDVSPKSYHIVRAIIQRDEYFSIIYKEYIADIEYACNLAGEIYSGSHAFRYCFAQRKYRQLMSEGNTELEARYIVSELMGHHRADITKLYSNCLNQ